MRIMVEMGDIEQLYIEVGHYCDTFFLNCHFMNSF